MALQVVLVVPHEPRRWLRRVHYQLQRLCQPAFSLHVSAVTIESSAVPTAYGKPPAHAIQSAPEQPNHLHQAAACRNLEMSRASVALNCSG